MSEDLLVRRHKMVQELRRKEIDLYMRNIRQRLLMESQITCGDTSLTDDDVEEMKRNLEDEAYSTPSIEIFLIKLKQFSTVSICNHRLFTLFERAIMHVLQWGQNGGSNRYLHNLAKEVVLRAIECPPSQGGRLPLQFCFKEVLQILTNHDLEMLEIWKAIALVRSQPILRTCFTDFVSYIAHYPEINEDGVVSIILEVYANFTATIQGHEKVSLPIDSIFKIIDQVVIIFESFELGNEDLETAMRVLENITKLHNFYAMIGLLNDSKIIPCLLSILDSKDATDSEACAIINLFIIMFSGQDILIQKILSTHEGIIPALTKLLPGFGTLTPFTSFNAPSVIKWPSYSLPLLLSVLTCFGNISACNNSAYLMLKNNILGWFIAFSAHERPETHAQVAIFLFNMVAVSSEEQVEILLEKDILAALNNVIREEYSTQAITYGLRTLLRIAQAAKNFPSNNFAWHFSLRMVVAQCQRMELVKYIEGLLLSKKEEVATYAQKCLNVLHSDQ